MKLTDLNPRENDRGFIFDCPCGGGHIAGVRTKGPGAWTVVSGTYPDTLTLSPSIAVSSGPGCKTQCWHGYLIEGEMRPV